VSLLGLVPAAWRSALADVLSSDVGQSLASRLKGEADILPPQPEWFAALEATPPSQVRVVLLGQDPYPTPGHAHGLAFSVKPGVKLPPSLKNLFKPLVTHIGGAVPVSGDLSAWARQGILLLNTVLTVRPKTANAHKGWGWEAVTEAVIQHVVSLGPAVVFLCLGKQASAVAKPLAGGHAVLEYPHPSPLAGNSFVDAAAVTNPFAQIDRLLVAAGRGTIDWQL
jgi:uracil-DNA glycosylase